MFILHKKTFVKIEMFIVKLVSILLMVFFELFYGGRFFCATKIFLETFTVVKTVRHILKIVSKIKIITNGPKVM